MKPEISNMIRRMEMHGNGAHAHTANKASLYLEDEKLGEKLLPHCESALTEGKWETLKYVMRKLW